MENKYLSELKSEAIKILHGENVKVVLFGSRVGNNHSVCSDVDIGIIPYGKFDRSKLAFLKEKAEGINIPYKVDIINFEEVSESFKKEALKEVVVWKE